MEANRSRTRWTYDEYARLPVSGTTRYEVIGGELAVTPSPTSGHQRAVGKLMRLLGDFADDHALGEVFPGPLDVLFGEGDYLQPDLVFVRAERARLVSERGVEGPPDLVIEILSPSTERRDRGVKLGRYRHFGVAEYWIVDLEARAIEVWRLDADAEAAEVVGGAGVIRWQPDPKGPVLDVRVAEVCR